MTESARAPLRDADSQVVLLTELDAELMAKLSPVLGRPRIQFAGPTPLAHALFLIRKVRFDAVLVGHREGLEEEIHDLLEALRAPDSASSHADVALFLPPGEMPFARAYRSAGARQIVSSALAELEIQKAVLGLLRTRARLATRLMARLQVRVGPAVNQRLCQTLDLSRCGMFVISDDEFPVGTPVEFALELARAGESVRGEARVARRAGGSRERPAGLGLEFLTLAGDGEARLLAYLERLRDGEPRRRYDSESSTAVP